MPPSPALGTERSRSHHSDQPHEKLENDRQSDRPIRRDYEKGRRSKAIRPPQLINDSKPAPTLLEPIGNIPPAEAEERYYAMMAETAVAA
jgi:hypothetical protein